MVNYEWDRPEQVELLAIERMRQAEAWNPRDLWNSIYAASREIQRLSKLLAERQEHVSRLCEERSDLVTRLERYKRLWREQCEETRLADKHNDRLSEMMHACALRDLAHTLYGWIP